MPGICPALEQAELRADGTFSWLESINKGFQSGLEGLAARGPWSSSWNKTNKNNYRAICENVKASTNTLTLVNLNVNLEGLAQPAFRMAERVGAAAFLPILGSFQVSYCLAPLPNPLLIRLAPVDQSSGTVTLSQQTLSILNSVCSEWKCQMYQRGLEPGILRAC